MESNETIDLQVSNSDDGLISLEPVSDTSFEELTIHEDVDMLENTEMASDFILDEEITAERLIIELSKLPPKTPIKIDGMNTPAIHFYFYPDSHISVLSSRSFSIPHSYAGEPRKPKQQEESVRE